MDCCKTNIVHWCHIEPQTWCDKLITFDKDVWGDGFEYEAWNDFTCVRKKMTVGNGIEFLADDKIVIEDPELPVGQYTHRLTWINDRRTILFEGTLKIKENGMR